MSDELSLPELERLAARANLSEAERSIVHKTLHVYRRLDAMEREQQTLKTHVDRINATLGLGVAVGGHVGGGHGN